MNQLPGEDGTTVTFVFPSTTDLGMGFPVRLNSVSLGAFFTFPFLLAVFSRVVLLDASEITQCSTWVMVDAGRLWTHINALSNFCAWPLLQLPRQVMPTPVQLQILIPLESFAAYFTHESVSCHQCVW